ncbi:MAG TPA: lantibiotic dehydratase, partial [Ktedonobacteraceae bacterium]|nr:lantibiotic dehydratase [Ktedonobacteraceae bacterium]
QIFNLKLSRSADDARTCAHYLAEDERPLLFEWLDLWERYQQHLSLGTAILNVELREKRKQLKQIINGADFRKGILLSSTILDQATDGYLASDNLQLNREARTVERSLLEYLFRAAGKTSPFSTFTPVCIGTLEEGETASGDDIELELNGVEKQSFTRLNMLVLSRLSAQILACKSVRHALNVRVTNGWRLRANHIEYVRRKSMVDTTDTEASLSLDYIQEHVIQLPIGAMLQDILEYIGDGHEEKLGILVTQLGERGGDKHAKVLVEEYLEHLLRLGFLIVPTLQVDIHQDRPLAVYRQKLRTIAMPQTDALADSLGLVEDLVDAYANAEQTKRAHILVQIRQILQEGSLALNDTQRVPAFPKTLLYEDTTLAPRRLTVSTKQWSETFAHIQELQQILPVFDSRLPQKIMTRGYFQARYGVGQRCDDFFSFADMFNQEFLRLLQNDTGNQRNFDSKGKFKGRTNYFNQPELAKLNQARQTIADYMHEAYQALPAGSSELILGEDFLQTIAPLAAGTEDFLSYAFLSQFARVNNEPLFIINQIYTGLTLLFSRFAYCFAQDERLAIISTLRQTLEQLQPSGAIFAELKGGYDATNLNLHPTFTSYEIVCPGELSARPSAEQISIEDLYIQDDTETGHLRLYSKRLGKEVIPIYLGFLTPIALPEIQQILLHFSYLTMSPLDLWGGARVAQPDTSFTYYPRLRYKNVVVQRATWRVQADVLPQRASGQSDTDFYLDANRWRKSIGLPARVFLTPIASASTGSNNDKKGEEPVQSYKPLYIDFENYFSILLLEATIRKASTAFQFMEMLPQPEQLWFRYSDQAYVSEFIFEVTHTRRDEHAARLD